MPGPTFLELARSIDNELKGNFRFPVKNVTAAGVTVLSALNAAAECDATLGAQSIQLPNATLNKGMFFYIKKKDASVNPVVLSCLIGGQTIDGVASKSLATQYDFIVVMSNGVGYSVFAFVVTPLTAGSTLYTVKSIRSEEAVTTLTPVNDTLIAFNVAVDGICFFSAAGIFSGLSGLIATDLAIYVDGVFLCHSHFFAINGSGGDKTGPVTQEPNGSLFLTAGPHTVELYASQTNIALQASAGDPLTLTVIYPGSAVTSNLLAPEAARVRTSAPVGINPAAVISFDTVDGNDGNLFNIGSPTRMTAQMGGWYDFLAQLVTDSGIDGSFRSLKIRKNGTLIVAQDQRDDFVHNTTSRNLVASTGPIPLAAGDYVEVIAETDATDSGGSTVAADDYSVVFAGARCIPGAALISAYGLEIYASADSPTAAAPGLTVGLDTKLTETPVGAFPVAGGVITVPKTGLWYVYISVIFASDVGGTLRFVNFMVNGVNTYNVDTYIGNFVGNLNVQGPALLSLNAGDLLRFDGISDSAGNPAILAGAAAYLFLVK